MRSSDAVGPTPGARRSSAPTQCRGAVERRCWATIVLITAIAPLATDMYVPAFPLVGRDLDASATEVQLTLTTFFVGMALGQLVGGPFSDRVGRRRPLLAALAALVAASVVCAFSPTVPVMMAARLVQGFAGGWAMVIARSVVVDLTDGAADGARDERGRCASPAPRRSSAPAGCAGPVGVALAGLVLGGCRPGCGDARRGGARDARVAPRRTTPRRRPRPSPRRDRGGAVLARASVGYLVVFAFSMGTTFAYVATSAYVLQSMNGLTPLQYSVDFAVNAAGMTAAALVAARYAHRIPARVFVEVGLAATGVAGAVLSCRRAVVLMPLAVALVGFFVLMTAQGLVGPNAGALASAEVPDHPGTGSALLGFLQWVHGRRHRAHRRPRRRGHRRPDGRRRPGPHRRVCRRLPFAAPAAHAAEPAAADVD